FVLPDISVEFFSGNLTLLCVRSFDDFAAFFQEGEKTAGGEDLIHKSTQDLWKLSQSEDGGYVLTRLFDEEGGPLKC
ncbi:MAG: hypothetical protein AAGM67_08135, partial [Bacteroidota bacterium]